MFIRRLSPERFARRTLLISLAVALLTLAGIVVVLRFDAIGGSTPRITVFEDPVAVKVDGATVGTGNSAAPDASVEPGTSATPGASDDEEEDSQAVLEVRLLAVRAEPLSAIEGQMEMPYGTRLLSVRLELTADRALAADPGRAMLVITDSNGEIIRASPTLHPELAPNLAEVDLKPGSTITGWLSFVVSPGTHRATLSLRPIGDMAFVVELPVEW